MPFEIKLIIFDIVIVCSVLIAYKFVGKFIKY